MRVRPGAILAWTALLSVLAWFGLPYVFARLQPERLPADPLDIAHAVANREAGERLAQFARHLAPGEFPLVERCHAQANDVVQLHYFDTWYRDAFTVEINADAHATQATWRTIRDEAASGFVIGAPERTHVSNTDWSALRAALQSPAFADMTPEEDRDVIDGFRVAIETCLGGAYHVVVRDSPLGPEYAGFLRHANRIGHVGGDVHALPEWLQ